MSREPDGRPGPGNGGGDRPNHSVLVVDDSPTIRVLLRDKLEAEGYRVVEAEDGDIALEVALRERPDLIICDINMPKVDGWEFCWNLRKQQDLRFVPFIFLTDRYGVSDRMRGLSIGAEDYITKPFDVRDLIQRLDEVFLKRREVRSEPVREAEASLMGKVQQFPLPDVLQNINRNGSTGILEVKRGTRTGRIHIRKGEVINSTLGAHSGKKAFNRLIAWEEGIFEFREEDPGEEILLQESTIRLILDGLKQQDEIRRLQESLPPGDAQIALVGVTPEDVAAGYPPAILSLFDLIRKHGVLRAVVDASPLDDLKIYQAVALLIDSGVLRLKGGG